MNDIRYVLRRLRAAPLVTASVIACLAIGVWMTSILASVTRGIFAPDLHVPEASRLVQLEVRGLYSEIAGRGMCCGRKSSKAVLDSLSRTGLFRAVGYYSSGGAYARIQGEMRSRHATMLSSGMMGVLGARPLLGRGLLASDDTTGEGILLSYQLWRSLYGGDSSIIGRPMRLERELTPRTIVGVMREDFMFPRADMRPDFYLSIRTLPGRLEFPVIQMLGRLEDGVSIRDADVVARRIAARNADFDREAYRAWWRSRRLKRAVDPPKLPTGSVLVKLDRYWTEPFDFDTVKLFVLIIACGLSVVAIGAANAMNLLLVRGAARRQELAVRMALGASRLRIIGELVTETTILAGVGVIVGLGAAWAQWQRIDRGFMARHFFGEIDPFIAAIALITGLVLAIVVGVWPGLRATSLGLDQVLRDARRSGFGKSPLEGVLGRVVAASTAGTVMLLICAMMLGLSARDSMSNGVSSGILESPLGFDDRLTGQERIEAGRTMLAKLRAIPGVARASLGQIPPNGQSDELRIAPEGQPETRYPGIDIYPVSDGYFETLGIPILWGRAISAREARDSGGSVVLGRALAGRLFPGKSPVGARFRITRSDSSVVQAVVVGVAEDIGGGSNTPMRLYVPRSSMPGMQASALILPRRGASRPVVNTALRSVPGIFPGNLTTMAERARASDARRYISIGFTLFAVVGLILAAVGTYGVVAYSVVRRTHEIGVRMALGAEGGRVTWMIIEQGLKVTLLGVIGGLLLSLAVTRILGGFIMDVNMNYPIAIVGVVVIVGLISLIACAIPGYRAGRLTPVDALRAE